jgi:hypothetical protein
MNNQSIFATPVAYMKYEDEVITFEMIGKDLDKCLFDTPFEYMKYEEKEFKL